MGPSKELTLPSWSLSCYLYRQPLVLWPFGEMETAILRDRRRQKKSERYTERFRVKERHRTETKQSAGEPLPPPHPPHPRNPHPCIQTLPLHSHPCLVASKCRGEHTYIFSAS